MAMKSRPKTEDDFINSSQIKNDIDSNIEIKVKDKTFPLRIPYKLHELAKNVASQERLSLHDYILVALKDRVLQDSK